MARHDPVSASIFLVRRHAEIEIFSPAAWNNAKTAIAAFLLFLGIDRAYNFCRFGSWTTTYIFVFGVQYRMLHPAAPPSFPFSGSLLKGLAGPFLVP